MILEKNGIKSKRIYNSIDSQKNISKKPWVVFVGRLTWGKGAHLIVPGVASILKSSTMKCFIVGNGMLKNLIYKQIKENKLEHHVVLKGQMTHAETLSVIAQAKVLLAPALWEEPFGRTALEAVSSGTPVIVSNRGGLEEIVTPWKNGFIVEPTEQEIRKAVRKVFSDYPKLQNSTKKLIPSIRKIFGKDVINDHLKLYATLTKKL